MINNVFISLVILVILYHCCITDMKNEDLQGQYGPCVHTGLPLALGKHPRGGGVNPPFAVLYILPVLTNHPIKKPDGCGIELHSLSPIPNSFFYLLKHEDMLY